MSISSPYPPGNIPLLQVVHMSTKEVTIDPCKRWAIVYSCTRMFIRELHNCILSPKANTALQGHSCFLPHQLPLVRAIVLFGRTRLMLLCSRLWHANSNPPKHFRHKRNTTLPSSTHWHGSQCPGRFLGTNGRDRSVLLRLLNWWMLCRVLWMNLWYFLRSWIRAGYFSSSDQFICN